MRTGRAFTLIELLIVVAIIAILAAIAVPNFLEAQTRAKVSRVKSDMRSTATAMEVYFIDSNRYPPDFQFGGGTPDKRSIINRLSPLTTPVAYITSVFEDAFAVNGVPANLPQSAGYCVPFGVGNQLVRPFPFDYAYRTKPDGTDEEVEFPGIWSQRIATGQSSVLWALCSVGPDNYPTQLGDTDPRNVKYDPTNGTVSAGGIFCLGPGIGLDGGPIR